MSQAARLHAARKGLEAVLRLARERSDHATAALAELALEASGETEAQSKRRADDAERKRLDRDRTASGHLAPSATSPPDVRNESAGNLADGGGTAVGRRADTRGGKGGGVSQDLLSDQIDPSKIGISLGEHERGPSAVHAPSANGGGWLGALMAAFGEGVQSVTGRPYPVQSGRPTSEIVNAVRAQCRDALAQADFARDKGAAWARVRLAEGRTLNPFDFGQWLASGEPPPNRKPLPGDRTGQATAELTTEEYRAAMARVEESARAAQQADAQVASRAQQAQRRPASAPARITASPEARPAPVRHLTADELVKKRDDDMQRLQQLENEQPKGVAQ